MQLRLVKKYNRVLLERNSSMRSVPKQHDSFSSWADRQSLMSCRGTTLYLNGETEDYHQQSVLVLGVPCQERISRKVPLIVSGKFLVWA